MALRSQGPPGLASNRDRREAPPWRVLPLVVVVDNIFTLIIKNMNQNLLLDIEI